MEVDPYFHLAKHSAGSEDNDALSVEDVPAATEDNTALNVKDEGAVKFVKSLSKDLVSAGLVINSLGCTLAFRAESGLSQGTQRSFLWAAVCYFVVSVNTAGIAKAIGNRLSWLEMAYLMVWLETVYIIFYAIVMTIFIGEHADFGNTIWAFPVATVVVLIITWSWSTFLGRPKLIVPLFGRLREGENPLLKDQ